MENNRFIDFGEEPTAEPLDAVFLDSVSRLQKSISEMKEVELLSAESVFEKLEKKYSAPE